MFHEMGRLQESHNSPRSKCSPSRPLNGLGTTMTVLPKLVKYTMSRGREAKVGSRSLCLQRKLSTSSANPRKIMQQMARRAPISCTNWAKNKSGESGVEVQRQWGKWGEDGQTSSWGKPLHWFPTKQLRKGTGMKQKRMMRKTVPLITPWDSGLQKKAQGNTVRESTTQEQQLPALTRVTHISFLDVLFRSIPYNLAEMKWSLNAGMSFSVARQPSADSRPFITSGRTGTGDMFSGLSGRYQIKTRF